MGVREVCGGGGVRAAVWVCGGRGGGKGGAVRVRARVVGMCLCMCLCMCMYVICMYTFSSERPPQPGAVKPSVLRLTAWRWHLGWG